MTNDVVYNAVLNALRVDKRGNALRLDEFNKLSPIVNRRVLLYYTKDFEDNIDNTNSIGHLKVFAQPVNLSAGVASLPSNYHRMIGEPYYADTGGIRRNIDVVTSLESSFREADYLTQSTVTHPTCIIGGQSSDTNKYLQIRVNPTTISSIYVNYLREPVTPFLDYYITKATMNYTFLAVGASHTVTTLEEYRDGTTGAKSSISVDWDWNLDDLPLIVALFLEQMGIIIPDPLLTEGGTKDLAEISQ